jgi:hypothetical protein
MWPAMPEDNANSSCMLAIEAGLHRGVELPLMRRRYVVGSGGGADIVLSDPEVAPSHAGLEIGPGGLLVAALDAPLTLPSGAVIQPGQSCRLRLPARLGLGAARLVLSRPARRGPGGLAASVEDIVQGSPAVALAAGVLSLMLVFAATLCATEGDSPPGPATRVSLPAMARVGADEIDGALAALRDHLQAAGLSGSMALSRADGAIVAQGAVSPDANAAWDDIHRWFDRTYAPRIALLSETAQAAAAPAPHLAIQAIWAGPAPYLVAGDGEKYGEGAVLSNGWTVDRIEPDRVLLRQGGQQVALRY